MKKIKWLIGAFIIMLCFIMNSEMYQNYVVNFTNGFYYLDIETEENRDLLTNVLQEAVSEFDAGIFAVKRHTGASRSFEYEIFADKDVYEHISEKYDIREGEYYSFFSGTTEIINRDFSAISERPEVTRFYFFADSDDMDRIFNYVNKTFATSFIHTETTTGFVWIINSIWVIVFMFLLLLTWFGIQFDKKKSFVRISLGASRIQIAVKAMLLDILIFSLEFILSFLILRNIIYVEYRFTETVFAFLLFLIANCFMNLALLKYRYKEILYGANLNESLLSNCYLMKAVTMIMAIASISINIPLIVENGERLGFYNAIEKFDDYSFPDYVVNGGVYEDTEDIYELMNKELFFDGYADNAAIFSTALQGIDSDGEDKDLVMLNDTNFILTKTFCDKINYSKDFTAFIPEDIDNYDKIKNDCIEGIERFLGINREDVTIDFVNYENSCEILSLDNNITVIRGDGFIINKNTSFIYCNLDQEKFKQIADINNADIMSSIMYNMNFIDKNALLKKYDILSFEDVPAVERLTLEKTSAQRILLINTVLSAFMLTLEFAIIITIIKLEYIVNAKTLAIKKILGYSVFRKNKDIFLLNIFAAFIGVVTNVILALMYKITVWYVPVLVGIALVIIEFLVMLTNIVKTERTDISKILKGGSL